MMVSDRHISKVLITGITGSGGSYLTDYIVKNYSDVAVYGISRWHSTSVHKNLNQSAGKVSLYECDLSDLGSILTVLKTVKPDAIFHLAASSNVRASFITPIAFMQNNIMGTANLFEAIRLSDLDPIVVLCSTSEVYGQVDPKNVPIKEDCPINPASPYAVSKVTQDLIGQTYFKNYKMKVIRTRMFTYLNSRRKDLFATSFARQVARIELGQQEVLLHGNLDSIRTLIDVRDAVESYWVAIQKCKFGEAYNIGGATPIRVGEFLNILKELAECKIISKMDPNLLRPTDVTLQIPDTTKFFNETGWKPRIDFKESVHNLLEDCRSDIKGEV